MRLFVAIELDEPFRQLLVELQEALRRLAPEVSYTRPANLHLTVKFIGEFEEAKLPVLCASLKEIPQAGEFTLRFTGLDFLPERGPIRIIAAAVDGGERLQLLQRSIEAACVKHSIPLENRRYHPHITLARARRPLPRAAKTRFAAFATPNEARSRVTNFVLMQSKLSNEGSEYIPLQHVGIS